jgi:hypothetical protein
MMNFHKMKRRFTTWKNDVYPPRPKIPLRDRFKLLRQVAAKHALTVYKKTSEAGHR